jgi:hypothetical protein
MKSPALIEKGSAHQKSPRSAASNGQRRPGAYPATLSISEATMPKYKVTVTEEIQYQVEVDADDEDAAIEDAVEVIVHAEDRDKYFVACTERYGSIP